MVEYSLKKSPKEIVGSFDGITKLKVGPSLELLWLPTFDL
jgi:hypothetical protein